MKTPIYNKNVNIDYQQNIAIRIIKINKIFQLYHDQINLASKR